MNLGFAKWIDRTLGRVVCALLTAARIVRGILPRRPPPAAPASILLVKFWGLGNIVMLLPVFRAFRRRHPAARITLLTLARNREILEGVEDLDECLFVEDRTLGAVLRTYFGSLWRVRRRRPDLAVDFEQFSRASAIFVFLSGGRRSVGLDTPGQGRGGMFHERVPYDDDRHATGTFLDLARAAGAGPGEYRAVPPPAGEADREAVRALLRGAGAGGDPLFVFHPGSGDNFQGRRWAAENFAHLADHLLDRHGGTVVVTGTRGEAPVADRVREAARRKDGVVAAAGGLSVRGLVALCERAALVVSNDTAPVHIASALGRPVLGLYGPNTPVLYGPLSPGSVAFHPRTPCSPCLTNFNYKSSTCRMPVCIRSIRVEEVAAAADRVLEDARAGRPAAEARIAAFAAPGPGEGM